MSSDERYPPQLHGIKDIPGNALRCLTVFPHDETRVVVAVGVEGAMYDKAELAAWLRAVVDVLEQSTHQGKINLARSWVVEK